VSALREDSGSGIEAGAGEGVGVTGEALLTGLLLDPDSAERVGLGGILLMSYFLLGG
jgi:hypothetical protein